MKTYKRKTKKVLCHNCGMKNSMTEDETIGFCKKIALFWNNKNIE